MTCWRSPSSPCSIPTTCNLSGCSSPLVPLAVFTLLVQRRVSSWWLLLPLAFAIWSLVHASGVHATVAGVLLGFAVPVRARKVKGKDDNRPGMAEHFEHLWRPISAGVAVPVFALFSAGVAIGGWSGLQSALTDPIAVGIIAGLVLGKPVGILTATYLTSKLTRRPLQKGLTWPDLTGCGPARRYRVHRFAVDRGTRLRWELRSR